MSGSWYNCLGGETIATTGNELLDHVVWEEPDAGLVARVKGGDAGAFGQLVARHQRAVYAIVSRMVSDRDEVDDIVQDVFVQAFKSLGGFKQEAAFRTWIYRIAVNTTIKHMKKARVRRGASIDDPANGLNGSLVSNGSDDPNDAVEKAERREAVRRAVETLPERHRAVVALHYFQNLTCDEIANIMGCSVGTVWSRLHYACKKLKGQLAWLGDD
ncbi:MAG: sigma-70 family RNA polymerase sigma factor [Armatimonadetes bacterium]|nr:sigma-70 family RNA polymerase sigma factor [Armatimonadota bacterium]